MTAIGLLSMMLAATPGTGICQLTYISDNGTREIAVHVSDDGQAVTFLRGDRLSVNLGPAMTQRLRDRCEQYRICAMPQQSFDRTVAHDARNAGLILPLPYADDCEVALPCGRLRCHGVAILATRLPENDSVQEFDRLRSDLEQVRSVVILGGPEGVSQFLQVARVAYGAQVRLSSITYADDLGGERVAHFRPHGIEGPMVIVKSTNGRMPVAEIYEMSAQ